MATAWTFNSGASALNTTSTAACATSTPIVPPVGALVICTASNHGSTAGPTGYTISDTSVAGGTWHQFPGALATSSANLGTQGWWKVATAGDNNGGSGVTVTATATGSTGIQKSYIECDVFTLPAGYTVFGIDLIAKFGGGTSIKTVALNPVSGSSYPAVLDQLAFTTLGMSTAGTNGGITGSNDYEGQGPARNLAIALTANDLSFTNQYAGLCQTQANPSGNQWDNTWTTARNGVVMMGATFLYTPPGGLMIALLNSV